MRRAAMLLVLLAAAACGESACKQTADKICARACACGAADGKCAIGDASGGLSFDSASDCRVLFGLGCAADESDRVDWDACREALDSATCTSGRLVLPDSCEAAE
jgi:hypothetical protein